MSIITEVPSKPGLSGDDPEPELRGAFPWEADEAEPPFTPVHQRFARQAARTPEAVAVIFGEQAITYRELDERANRLARHLAGRGVGRETRVGVCLERGPEMPVALLAVLKAGGAYVPLDPEYPRERTAAVLADCRAPVVIASEASVERVEASGARVVVVDREADEIASHRAEPVEGAVDGEQLAYVIYTSGSTGRPKGVAVPHRAIANHTAWMQRAFPLGAGDRMLQKSPFGFDASVWEFWTPLAAGAALVIARPGGHRDPGYLVGAVQRHGVTVLQVVPSLLRALAEVPGLERCDTLRTLFCGAEALPATLCAEVSARLGARIVNLYGPTEACIDATVHVWGDETEGTVPIGRAIDGAEAHVLDGAMRPADEGELYLGGVPLARGYLHAPALTAERFVPSPFGGAGARLYRTGDRVRKGPAGVLDFIGRADFQVKVRGHRIEPGEVEAVLAAHPGVHACVVVAREDVPGLARLAAYVVPPAGAPAPAAADLRRHARGRLPEYMVPSAFVALDALPLSPSGKVDRAALPAPDAGRPPLDTPYVAPRTEAEARIAEIWGEVLGMQGLGVDDDPFELGGHSLAVTQVAARIREAFGAGVPLHAVFEARSIAALAAEVEQAAADDASSPAPAAEPLGRAPGGERIPLSLSQEPVWFLDQLAPDNLSYNFQAALTFRGALDVGALRRALTEIVRRHEVMRTTFPSRDGRPWQQVHAPHEVDLPLVDLAAMHPAERAETERDVVADAIARRFDLTRLPLARWLLVRRAPGEHLLLHVEHHLLHDGWGFNLFLRELLALYGAFAAGRPSPLAEPALQFGDYAYAQRRWMEGAEAAAQLRFWTERLAGTPPLLELPFDRPRPARQRFRGAAPRFELPADLYRRLRTLSRRHGVTLFATMLAAYQVLLSRWSGQPRLNVGTGIANRRRGDTEGLLGMFVNSLVLRAALDDDPTFAEAMRRAGREVVEAAENQELPFEVLVEALRPDRSLGHNPLCQAMFSFHDAPIPALRLPGLEVEVLSGLSNGSAKFDLNVVAIPRAEQRVGQGRAGEADGITLVWEYDSDLFDAATIHAMVGQYQALLEAAAAAPDTPVSRLPLASPEARAEVLSAGAGAPSSVDDPADVSIPALFAARAARTPGALAIVSDGEALTYRALEERANRLAHHLRALGAGAESRVALCLERGAEMVTAMLAVLKAGGAYVPLDPGYPAERLEWMLADSAAAVLVTKESQRATLPAPAGVRVVSLDGDAAEIASRGAEVTDSRATAASLAYVIYTSGSTGTPKGVAVEHRGVVRLVRGADYVQLGPGDRVAQASSVSFDAATFEVWGALLNGAALVILPRPVTLEPALLAEAIASRGITTLFLTTALFNQVARERPDAFNPLATLLFGGEAVDPAAVRRVLAAGGPRRLLHVYGPTENTTYSTWHPVDSVPEAAGTVPIGGAIARSAAWVLDAALEPAPLGVPGELYVAGDGVARGYLGRPALTAERFVPDPFSHTPGARMYRTGDRVRWTEDEPASRPETERTHALTHSRTLVLEYRGRLDRQVKIRGFRIELGEVEAALRRAPSVDDCVVLAREDEPGERRLVAYVAGSADAESLRAHLRRGLPDHMVPAAIVVLPTLPLNANGKIDTRALPAPESAVDAERYVAPRTAVEVVLAGIWAEVLRLERVGVTENFFDLGGHSLLATRVVSRVRDLLGVEMPLRMLFEAAGVADLAARVEALLPHHSIRSAPRGERLAASFAQERLWFVDRLHPGSAVYNMPAALRLEGALHVPALERALGEIIRRHEALRTTFRETPGGAEQVIAPFAGFTLPVQDLSAEPSREALARRAAEEDATRAFDLAAGPLFRARLLRIAPDDHLLSLCIHHVVCDGWSLGLLFRELAALYPAFRDGRPSPLAPLPAQVADHAAWERAEAAGTALEPHLAWWREQLAGAPALLEVPTDRPRPAVQSFRGERVPVSIAGGVPGRLWAVARARGATPYMVLLAAFQVLLSKYAGTEDVVVGSPVAGRTRRELEGLIGCFVNTLPLRADLSGDPTFDAVLRQVRDTTLAAWEHQELPFERLVAELQPGRSAAHSPLFQVTFTLEDGTNDPGGLPGLRAERVDADPGTAKYDLALTLGTGRDAIRGVLVYATDLFERATVERMVAHLGRVLEQVAADPSIPLSRVELMDAAERRRVLAAWNPSAGDLPPDAPVHRLFEAWAEQAPDATAVRFDDTALTYRELNERANRLAHHLRAAGVRAEARVALFLERGMEMVTAMLAVLKAGGAYVPLDPAYPAERLEWMLADSDAAALVTDEALRPAAPARAGVAIVSIDGHAGAIAGRDAGNVAGDAEAGALAYVIYTSGSTGKPKGVAVEHRGVVRLVRSIDYMRLGPDDRVAQGSTASFDAATFEIWGALLNGAALVGIPREVVLSPPKLAAAIRTRELTALFLTTALFNQVARELPDAFNPLRTLLFGGEAADADAARRVLAAGGPGRLLHVYGPTENTTYSTWHHVTEVPDSAVTIPIGGAVANSTVYVLDGAGNPVPDGIAGELCVGGLGVARGYLNRPALTAERFIPDPFSATPGARMYRTGDRVRWTADGAMYLGRLDGQVKIRGFRIEPGEIECTLGACPGVREARVIVREDVPGEKRLVAYVAGAAPAGELRQALRRTLPEHMVPAAFVSVDAFPLLPSGKLDHRALPAPVYEAEEGQYVAPRTPAEETLAAIWAEVLRLERVGVQDNFFELGGESILCILVVSLARQAGLEITPRQMFEYQTIAELASVAGRAGEGEERRAEQGRVDGRVPLTPIQAWFFEAGQPEPWHANQWLLLDVDPSVDAAALETALMAVLDHHDALRLRFRRTDAGWEQWHADAVGIALEHADLSALSDEAADAERDRIAAGRHAALELEHGPIGRAVLFRRGAGRRELFITLHHLVVDVVSWRILREDLARAVVQAQAGDAIDLGVKSTSLREWAHALEASAAELADEAAFWLAQGPDGVAPLPLDGEGARTVAESQTVTVRLDADDTRALLQEVPAVYRTQINDVLLCALAEAVGAWSGGARVRIALEGHGREEEIGTGIDLTRAVGWFTTIYPVVLDVEGAAGPGERLKRVKEQLRDVPRRGIGYGVLRYLSADDGVRAALAAQPEPEVSFNFLGRIDPGAASDGPLRPLGAPRGHESPRNPRRLPLSVYGSVADGTLRMSWTYSEGTHRRDTIERLAGSFIAALHGLIAHCREPGAGGCTPSDFPLAALTQEQVDAVAGRGVEDLYPLSPMQAGLLFHALEHDARQAYQVQVARRLEGRLDADLLRRAWDEVAARHAILRTGFVWDGVPRPLQRVESSVALPWTVEDWTALAPAEQEAALARYMADDRARGFALDRAPLLRCALFGIGEDAHWLVTSFHHLLLDGWSLSRVTGEVLALYRAWSGGQAPSLARVRPYRDYIAWLQQRDPGAAERHWRGVLAGFHTPTPLGVDRPAGAEAGARFGKRRLALPAELTARLEGAARRHQVTVNTVLQGAWGLLLSRYAGEDDVVFGNTVSGRAPELDGVEEMVGLFINTLPVRMRLRPDERVSAWLPELQRAQARSREHEHAPLVQVQGWSEVPRGTALFDTLFVYENYPAERGGGHDAALRVAETRGVEWTTYPLTLTSAPGRELPLSLGYDESRFDAETADRMLAHLATILAQLAADADPRLSEITLTAEEERRLLVEEWGRGAPVPADERPIHFVVAEQAARTPDAWAIRFDGQATTYRELDEAANRLAHHLAARGVGPEARVGILGEREPGTVVAILAVLKAGGAYLPLDPAYPAERLRSMLDDAGARMVIAPAAVPAALADLAADVLDLRAEADAIAARPSTAPAVEVDADGLAYVIYTSGSTGQPKGVMVAHRGVPALARSLAERLGMDESSRMLQFASFSFDAAVLEVFTALARGATLVMAPRDELLSAPALADLLRREQVSVALFPPSLLAVLSPDELPDLSTLMSGGEALPRALVGPWSAGRTLINAYGPTEATVSPCVAVCQADGRTPPIGRPLDGATLYVLDAAGHPCPVGVPGELYIGGAGVARGYRNRARQTAQAFVPDPFGAAGGRLYRTGDRVRWRGDGQLEYVGRLDAQVKVRGFRIEPGEIEHALGTHPAVRDARVLVREAAPGDRRLVAYVVGDAAADELRGWLRRTLPEHMVPAAFVPIDTIPLTPNGKLDRRALPAPELASAGERYVAPRSETEAVLAEIWAEVLRVERVGVEESFFELGGDSLLTIQVASRARRAGVVITPRQMFEHPTIAALAAAVERTAVASPAVPEPTADGRLPLTPVQAWFFEQDQPVPGHFNQSTLLEVDASVDGSALGAAVAAVFAHHDALRLRFRRTADGWEPWHADDAGIVLERIDLSDLSHGAQDHAQGELTSLRQAGLDVERGPLGCAVLFDRGAGRRVLFLAIHHLAVDAVSWQILREDLESALAQAEAGAPVDLGDKSTPFADWARALDAAASNHVVRSEAAHWLAQGPGGVTALPVDGAGGRTYGDAGAVTVALSADETRALLHEVPAAYRTRVDDVLLCALAESLAEWSGGSRVRLALEGHGREEDVAEGADLTRTVGWFTSIYPAVLDVGGANGPGERLKQVKEQLRAIPRRGVGYGILRYRSRDAALRRALAEQPDPEVAFNYLGRSAPGASTAAGRLRSADGPRGRDTAGVNLRRYPLSVDARIDGGTLRLRWTYGEGTHRRDTIERVAGACLGALRGLIAHCLQAGAGGCTPSDFPLARITQAQLDAIAADGRGIEDLYPLSPLQEGILFHALEGGAAQAYQVQGARLLEGALDVSLFQRAWARVAQRHAILRTSFAWRGVSRPLQRVEPAAQIPWTVGDWTHLSAAEQEAALEQYLADDTARGFELDRAPLLRCALFRAGGDAHWFVWSIHHLLLDGWSSARVLAEVFRLYAAWRGGQSAEPARVRPYRDYIAWLEARDPGQAERYWRGVLAGFTAPTPLGVDRPAAGAPRHVHADAALPAGLTRRLEAAARGAGVTLNTLVQGAWAILLSRYAGEDDVVFGNTVAGRPAELERVEAMVGLFINTLPVRVRVRNQARLGAWLRELQTDQAEAREHEHAPLARVQGWSDVPRGTPLFESLYVFENYPVERAGGNDGAALRTTRSRGVQWTNYPLTLIAIPGDELRLIVDYDAARIDAAAVDGMHRHLRRLLEQAADSLDLSLCDLELLDAGERDDALAGWAPASNGEPPAVSVHRLFEARADAAPGAVALVFGGETATYGELNARANRLARHLRALGVGDEARVALCLERGTGMIVAMLAVLKAGGAYVPLDPAYPPERRALMLADSGAAVVVTEEALRGGLPNGVVVVSLDGDADKIAARPAENLSDDGRPDALAYVLYTSGSTGTPKGVAVEHRAIVRLVRDTDYVRIQPDDRVAQASTASFDAATFEVWGALLNGAALVGIPREVIVSPAELAAAITRQSITTLFLTTALFNAVARERPDAFNPLRHLLFGGEAADVAAVRRVLAAGGPARLLNAYGPTENTTFSTWHRVDAVDEDATTVPIGGPVAHSTVRVLDGAGNAAPAGVPGELYVGGAGVARGYLGRPALTAERFIPDPFSLTPGARMYRTGDRVRWMEDEPAPRAESKRTHALTHSRTCSLEYLGRLDEQAKIRGFRIEPGEVEGALHACPGVGVARVIVREDRPGEKRLVAYVTGAVRADELRDRLRGSLPEHLVPAAFVVMDALPLNPNGKVDLRALPAPPAPNGNGHAPEPRTGLEARIAEIWRQVLDVGKVGVEDNFFDLGGHSLLLIQVQSRLAAELGREVAMVELFEFPTVRALAARLQGGGDTGAVDEGEGRGGARQAALGRRMEARRRRTA